MSAYILVEAELAAHSFFLGIALMISYDCLRLWRLLIPHGDLWTGLEDMAYWICSAFVTFSLLLRENNGVLRGYVIICVFFGMFLYDRIVSRNVFGLLKNGIRWFTIKTKQRKTRREVRENAGKP